MAGLPRTADEVFAQEFAEAMAEGMTNTALMAEFDIGSSATVVKYKSDPRVTSRVRKLINVRVQEITRRVDSEMAKRLQNADEMSVDELLRIRKEYMGGAMRDDAEKTDEKTILAAMQAAESPEFQAALEAISNA